MGLFKRNSNETKRDNGNERTDMNQALFKELTQDVALTMCQSKITDQPILKYLHNDAGIFENVFDMEMNNPTVSQLRAQSIDTYLFVLGMHALGAGIYTMTMQPKFKKPVSEFSENEVRSILTDFCTTDAYELALNKLDISLDSQNKKVLDHIISVCLNSAKESTGAEIINKNSLKAFMQVLFNAGVTLIMK